MLPGLSLDEAVHLAERMRAAVQAADSPLPGSGMPLTISVGVAVARPQPGDVPKPTLILADRMLYAAKRGGRNRVSVAEAPPSPVRARPA